VYSSETLDASASFDLSYVIYTHALSPIASHLLVACATQHPAIRLVDLRSGANTHSLVGHTGAVLALSWSPVDDNILASGATDGTVRFWDVRRSTGTLGVLDMEDSVGISGYDGFGRGSRGRLKGRAHDGVVNGVMWTKNGKHVVTAGHDDQIRVWDTSKGSNTLSNFGHYVKNSHLSTLTPQLAPKELLRAGRDILFYPSDREILMYELYDGQLLKRLRASDISIAASSNSNTTGPRNPKNRTTALAWRAHAIELYSAHADGMIRSWIPRTNEDVIAEEGELLDDRYPHADISNSQRRKRKALQDIYEDLTRKKITFS
jgi:DNA excision repair protein ERCC-8